MPTFASVVPGCPSRWGAGAFALIASLAVAAPVTAQDEWDRALHDIVRLEPSDFPGLPDTVRAELEGKGCRVPQTFVSERPHNVITGHFAAPTQTDWAALCSRGDTSAIVVVWGGPARCPSEVATGADRNVLQGIGEGRVGYSRLISPADGAAIRRYADAFGGAEPPPIDHEGIDDAFVDKVSVIRYCYQGRWLRLQGAD